MPSYSNLTALSSHLFIVGAIMLTPTSAAAGQYEGRVIVEWVEHDGSDRLVKLIEPFSYIDDNGKAWRVPAGALVDGASIPRVLWTTVGSPFVGDYRYATVIHDYYCDQKTETWQNTHRVFYDAMLTSGVSRIKAAKMYAAVRAFGPRWARLSTTGLGGVDQLVYDVDPPGISDERLEEVFDKIENEGLDLDEIDQFVDSST